MNIPETYTNAWGLTLKSIIVSSLLVLCLMQGKSQSVNEPELSTYYFFIDSLIKNDNFFAARDFYLKHKSTLTEYHQLLSGASIDNFFNRLDSSNQKINLLLKKYDASLTDSIKYTLLTIKQANHGKLYEYREAFNTINQILNRYNRFLSTSEKQDTYNTRIIWKSLANQPKQTIEILKNTRLPILRDKVGLANLTVTNGKEDVLFVFDTGANFSTVTETMANKFKMALMDSVIDVTGVTGNKVKTKIAVCPLITLGHIKIHNAVFLVFPDSALAFPQISFQLNGVIGFPIIEAMKELQITHNDEFTVPRIPSSNAIQNMALDFLTPVIDLNGESYTFDTGADGTMLYDTYFSKHKAEIEGLYKETELNIGGAGGNIRKKGYKITFSTIINNKHVSVDSVFVFKEKIKEEKKQIYGNIGQDLIRKFEKMTLNFDAMFIKFE
jgi:hypothetical protein